MISLKWSPRGAPSKVRTELDKIRKAAFRDIVDWGGTQAQGIAKRRMQRGIDINDKDFVDYAYATTRTRRSAARLSAPKSTGRQPHKELRRRLGYQVSHVDLKMTGGLVDAVRFRSTGQDSGILEVDPSHREIAEGLQTGRYARLFVGISPKGVAELNKRTDNELERRLKPLTGGAALFAKAGAKHFTSGKAWKRVGG